MARRPQPKAQRPSPLAQVHLTRPISLLPPDEQPEMGLVRDPAFWKRFSTAVHRAETFDSEKGSPVSSIDMKDGDHWLAQQHKEKRRCRTICVSITIAALILIAGAAFAGYYLVNMR